MMQLHSTSSIMQRALKLMILLALLVVSAHAQDAYDEYVREVLEEDGDAHGDFEEQGHTMDDSQADKLKQQQQQKEARRRAEAKNDAQEKADKLALEREMKFEAELAKMNEEKRKLAMKKKKNDAKIVKSILKAAKNERHYEVLGIRNWQLKIPSKTFQLIKFNVTVPGFTFKETTSKNIRQAFRSRSLSVHPDKNCDGRAEEAFMAVENAASILSDKAKRAEYDALLRIVNRKKREKSMAVVRKAVRATKAVGNKVVWVFRKILGPFATPVAILGVLII